MCRDLAGVARWRGGRHAGVDREPRLVQPGTGEPQLSGAGLHCGGDDHHRGLLTSLVVAREWERGTMEALLATPVTKGSCCSPKLLPYYGLGIIAMLLCLLFSVAVMGVPWRGSLLLLFLVTSVFLGSALGLGLFLSTVMRSQFNAAQAALIAAFLPAVMLSGFVFEIASMPPLLRAITHLIPARYFASSCRPSIRRVASSRSCWSTVSVCCCWPVSGWP